MTLYLDSLFIINFVMNYIILLFTGKITNQRFRRKISIQKYLFGSLLTTILYLLTIVLDLTRNNYNFIFGIVIISFGILITFRPKTFNTFLTYLLFTHVVAFAVGGATYGIFYYTKAGAFIGNTIVATSNNISIKLLIAATAFSYIVIKLVVNYIEKTRLSKQIILDTNLIIQENIEIPMLVDTGNTLVDPITKLPVVVVYYKNLEGILDTRLYSLYEENCDVMTNAFNLDNDLCLKLKIIPFKSVGCSSGIILGFESRIEFKFEDINYSKNCIVGIVDFEIAKNKEYKGIFNPMLIKEEVVNVKKVIT